MQLSRSGTNRGISALSSTFRRRSRSKSSDKSSSPTSPSSQKFAFKYSHSNILILLNLSIELKFLNLKEDSTGFGFIGQALLFNADALCAPVTPPIPAKEPVL